MKIQLAFYKGPPDSTDLVHVTTHNLIKLRTWSKYSHAELVINGWSFSSSVRDRGVRRKKISFNPNRWDVIEIDPSRVNLDYAFSFFARYEGAGYDWLNILRYVLPFVKQKEGKFVCFELIGAMLNFAGYHRLDADDLMQWALLNQKQEKVQDEDYRDDCQDNTQDQIQPR